MTGLGCHTRRREFRRWANPGLAASQFQAASNSVMRAVASTLYFSLEGKQIVLIVINEVTLVIEEEHPIISIL
jgi:hypothetical protein